MTKKIELKGRVLISFDVHTETGLHIGGSDTHIEIGGVDKTVIRDPKTNRPYIPGSSLKGKIRSLLEKYHGLEQNRGIGSQSFIHSCEDKTVYEECIVCRVFGLPGEEPFATPTRLVVRDVHMDVESAEELEETGRTDLPYSEVKVEVSIDRVTSAANPRNMERVPAGVIFDQAELIYNIYSGDGCDQNQDVDFLKHVVEGLLLLEDDYLGGLGSRGSGKVRLKNIQVSLRTKENYLDPDPFDLGNYERVRDLAGALGELKETIKNKLS